MIAARGAIQPAPGCFRVLCHVFAEKKQNAKTILRIGISAFCLESKMASRRWQHGPSFNFRHPFSRVCVSCRSSRSGKVIAS